MFNDREIAMPSTSGGCDTYVQPTITERLMRKKKDLESQLERVNSALTALNEHPQVQVVIDTISKLSI